MKIVIDCDKEIKRLVKSKEELIDKFIFEAEQINSQIKYIKQLKEGDEVEA